MSSRFGLRLTAWVPIVNRRRTRPALKSPVSLTASDLTLGDLRADPTPMARRPPADHADRRGVVSRNAGVPGKLVPHRPAAAQPPRFRLGARTRAATPDGCGGLQLLLRHAPSAF